MSHLRTPRMFAAAALAVVAAACAGDSPTQVDAPEARAFAQTVPEADVLLCKITQMSWDLRGLGTYDPANDPTYGVPFTFEYSADGGAVSQVTMPAADIGARLANGQDGSQDCRLIYEGPSGVSMNIVELNTNSVMNGVFVWDRLGPDPQPLPGGWDYDLDARRIWSNSVPVGLSLIYVRNTLIGTPVAEGRMTGGGVKAYGIDANGQQVRVTLGLTLHCDNELSNNLEVNWPHRQKWHIQKESLTNVLCTLQDDPTPPAAPISRFQASAVGRLNGGDFDSLVEFVFEDLGEPGRNDRIQMKIYPGLDNTAAPVLTIDTQNLAVGNFQMHYDQPHGQKKPKS